MAIVVESNKVLKMLHESYMRCTKEAVTTCLTKDMIDFVMQGKNCLTYRYIMFTAIAAKAVNPDIDILSLQASDTSSGAYDARSLCKETIFQFQKLMLGNIIDGSNNDPLVNKPARFPRLQKTNPVAGGDPAHALEMLCTGLPRIVSSDDAKECIDYIISMLLEKKRLRAEEKNIIEDAVKDRTVFDAYLFLSSLLDQGFGGAALVLVTAALYHIKYADASFKIIAHPVNQAGSSKRQFSDLDLLKENVPYLGTELKDKPFRADDVERAADTALKVKAKSLLFVAGRQSSLEAPASYFNEARQGFADKGILVGITTIDDLLDTTFTEYVDSERISHIYDVVRETAEEIGALEAQTWIYKKLAEKQA